MLPKLVLTLLVCAGWSGLAVATAPQSVIWWLSVGLGLMFLLPLVMAVAITLVCLVMIAVVSAAAVLASPWRRGGLAELNRELIGKGTSIVPGYVDALRRVRSPGIWCSVLGSACAWLGLVVYAIAAQPVSPG